MSAERWARVVASLAASGVTATVTEKPFPGGISHSITIPLDADRSIWIGDSWWRKNDQVWIGWQTHVENNRTRLVERSWPITKKRGDVVRAVFASRAAS